ncbi:hypothetical protein [Salinirubrum litoreum]|uniref:BNR repeat-containing family member n=1 Tax=Salinirubrum litoreum TaxID=1126234 RepID=A0ABD5RGH3_9EURY|nr:hypothetical protein [Salinirubrum litoreum]
MSTYGRPPDASFADATTVLSPPGSGQGHWVGAPCVHRHGDQTYLAVRWRTPEERGHAVTVYEYDGPASLSECARITADDLGVVSVERAALCTNPRTGDLQCYLPVDRGGNDWVIQKLGDVADPETFDPTTAHTVLAPTPGTTDGGTVKDPVVDVVGGQYVMFYAGADGLSEQAHLATSVDGETWTKHLDNPVVDRAYWHDHHVRVSTVVPATDAPVWLVFYDGSGVADHGRTWNLRTGMAVSPDLRRVTDTSPDGPVYESPVADRATGVDSFATCRYLDVLRHDDEWELFAEVARPDESFELRHLRTDPP